MAARTIDNLFCIFDMTIHRALNLSHPISTRAIITYNRGKDSKEFQILNKELNSETHHRLLSWMHQNINVDNILHHLKSNEIDMDQLGAFAS